MHSGICGFDSHPKNVCDVQDLLCHSFLFIAIGASHINFPSRLKDAHPRSMRSHNGWCLRPIWSSSTRRPSDVLTEQLTKAGLALVGLWHRDWHFHFFDLLFNGELAPARCNSSGGIGSLLAGRMSGSNAVWVGGCQRFKIYMEIWLIAGPHAGWICHF